MKPAVFIDRDNTLIEDPGYLADPGKVRLLNGAADALKKLRSADYEVVVVTNQSGVARGLMTEEDVQAVHRKLRELLLQNGTDTDAIYYCPYLDGPEAVRETYRRDSEMRKPKPGMLLLAAKERGIDLSRSWMIGDSSRDMVAGKAAGCRTILLANGGAVAREGADFLVPDIIAAADMIIDAPRQPETESPAAQAHLPAAHAAVAGPMSRKATERVEKSVAEVSQQAGSPRVEALLEQIVEEMRTDRRERQHDEFSLGHLAGSVVQAFALCAIGWGVYAAINGDANAATVRLLGGIAFQMMALTFFVASKRK